MDIYRKNEHSAIIGIRSMCKRAKSCAKAFMGMAAMAMMLMAFAGCGSEQAADNSGAGKPLDVTINTNRVSSALTVLGENAGFYKEEGIDVNLHVMNVAYADILSALTSGKVVATTGGVGSTAPLRMIEEGANFVIIGGQMSEGADIVTVPERADEWKQENLTQKKIGVVRTASGDIALRGALSRKGIDLSTIQFVELGNEPAIIEAIKKGELDAGNVQANLRDTAHQAGLVSALHIDDIAPDFICCRIITTPENLQARRGDFVKFLRAQLKAYRLIHTDEEKALPLINKSIEVDPAVLKSQVFEDPHLGLVPDPAKLRVEDFYDSMKRVGYIEGKVNIDDHIDASLYQEALASLLAEEPDDPTWNQLKADYIKNDGPWPDDAGKKGSDL